MTLKNHSTGEEKVLFLNSEQEKDKTHFMDQVRMDCHTPGRVAVAIIGQANFRNALLFKANWCIPSRLDQYQGTVFISIHPVMLRSAIQLDGSLSGQ